MCQSIPRVWADPGIHQSTAQAVPDGFASAFQLAGLLALMLGPVLKTPLTEMPHPRQGRKSIPGQPSNIPDFPHNNRHMCPAIIHPSLYAYVCVRVRVCVCVKGAG